MTDKDNKSQSKDTQSMQDSALWKAVTKDITPLKGNNIITPDSKNSKTKNSAAPKQPRAKHQEPYEKPLARKRDKSSIGSSEVDHRTKQRLKRGQIDIEGRLDLHGMSKNDAHHALLNFIPSSHAAGKRCILVITGKGHYRHGDPSLLEQKIGILKQKTPEWLSMPPLDQYVLNIQPARPQHGGEGAIYVLLRRNRE